MPLGQMRTAVLASVAGSLAMALVAPLLVWLWRGSLPKEIASHWNAQGAPNGFSAPMTSVWTLVAVMSTAMLIIAAVGFGVKTGTGVTRTLVGTILFLGAMTLTFVAITIAPQRGIENPAQFHLSAWSIVALLGIPAVVAVAGTALIPNQKIPDSATHPVSEDNAPHTEVLWTGRTSMKPVPLWIGMGLIAAVLVVASIASQSWIIVIAGLAPIVLVLLMSTFTIRVDNEGLLVRAWLGWPNRTVSARQIESVVVTEVSPFQEFGGWGLRSTIDAEGIVLRAGPAIRVTYGDGSVLVVTVNNGAEQAAALLGASAAQSRQTQPHQIQETYKDPGLES